MWQPLTYAKSRPTTNNQRLAACAMGGKLLLGGREGEMDLLEVVRKLVGEIDPVGETNEDNKRFENLKVLTDLVDSLLTDIDRVNPGTYQHEYSRIRAAEFVSKFFTHIGISND